MTCDRKFEVWGAGAKRPARALTIERTPSYLLLYFLLPSLILLHLSWLLKGQTMVNIRLARVGEQRCIASVMDVRSQRPGRGPHGYAGM